MSSRLRAWLRTARVVAGPPLRWAHSAARGQWRHKRVTRTPAGKPLIVNTPDGLRLSALLYPASVSPAPAMLVLHGWDPLGQRHGYYVALAREMRQRGVTVMTLNLRGYPGSDRPPSPQGFNLPALVSDVRAALETLRQTNGVDSRRLVLFGHSYGAGIVLPVLAVEPALWRAVVHGPSIWVEERITGPQGPQRAFFHERYWRYMAAKTPIPLDVYLRVKQDLYLLQQLELLQAGHAPLLLVDGGAEGSETDRFMRLLHARLPSPCDRFTVPGADHFCNTAAIGPWLVEDRYALGSLGTYLTDWLWQHH